MVCRRISGPRCRSEDRRSLACAPCRGAALRHPLQARFGASPAAGGRSQVRLLTLFFGFFLLVLLLGGPRAIQLDRHPAEELT